MKWSCFSLTSRDASSLILASRSPQRRAILEQLGVLFSVLAPDVEELEQGVPEQAAVENAVRKARAVAGLATESTVLAVDTVVCLGGHLYGKPADALEARATLEALSGRSHLVISGLCVIDDAGLRTASAETAVRFRPLDRDLIDWYLGSGEWSGRAGGYAIQGRGAALVEAIEGDYTNVVGLPVPTLLGLLPGILTG